ncbi:MAG: alpha-2-macroglobulin [Alphaproteobacteria bacterium]
MSLRSPLDLFRVTLVVLAIGLVASAGHAATDGAPAMPGWLADQASEASEYLSSISGSGDGADAVTLAERRVSVREMFAKDTLWDVRATLERVLADAPDDYAGWVLLGLSITYRSDWDDPVRRAAAFHAWQTASDNVERAVALWVASEVASDPLEAQRDALALADQAAIVARIEALKENYPPQFIALRGEGVANETGGSACISFSHPLVKPRVSRYDDFVEVAPPRADLAVIASGRQLCIDGVRFGESITVTLRPGLPGVGDRKLESGASFEIAVPHRASSLRFRESGYVLPSHGPQLVPLEAVNLEGARIRVFRVVERNLIAALQTSFPGAMREWQVNSLAWNDGELVFDGAATLGGERDRTVTIGLPVSELIGGPLEPGVYLIAASPEGGEDAYGNIPVETTQWLMVSDIGLNLLQGPDGLHVFTRSLASAAPLAGVEVALVARSNRVLARATSDAAGHVLFDRPLVQGEASAMPVFVRAEADALGFTFVPFSQGALDLSDRGVAGRDDPGPVDGFVFAERGVYRPGETVHLTTLLRDGDGRALAGVPLTLRLVRPDGIEATRVTRSDAGSGGYSADLALALGSMTGQWTVYAHLDPERPEIGRASFLVEDFVPPTIEVKAAAAPASVTPNQAVTIDVQADYFFGAPAAELRVDASATLRAAETPFPGFEGYRFGLEEEPWSPRLLPLGSAVTDAAGAAPLQAAIPLDPDTTHPLEAEITASVFEVSGRAVSAKVVVPFRHQAVALGVRPNFADGSVGEGDAARFDIVAVASDGSTMPRSNVAYTLYREEWSYIWFKRYDAWDYEVSVRDNPVARGTLDLEAGAPVPLSLDVGWGRYRIEVADAETGAATSLRFTAGWWVAPGAEGRPDAVHVRLDKASYHAGDVAQVHVEAPYAGQLVLMRAGATLEVVHSGPIDEAGTTVPVTLGPGWLDGPGSYVLAAVYRPGEDLSVAMPARALGVAWLAADPAQRDLALAVAAPNQMRPDGKLAIEIEAKDAGRSAFAVVAAVDEAVLGLTGYETPDPLAHVMAQRRLAYEIRDTYGRLIDPRDAPRGVLRTGGDGIGGADVSPAIRSTRVVSLFSGIVTLDDEGRAVVALDVPDFAGRLRVMAVAWSADRLGHAEADVTVRDPVVATLNLPRFLAPGDEARTLVTFENIDGPAGDYQMSLGAEGPLDIVLEGGRTATLAAGGRAALPVTLKGNNLGAAALTLAVDGPDGLHIERHYDIALRPSVNATRRSTLFTVGPAQSYAVPGNLTASLLPESAVAKLSLGVMPDLGAAGHVDDLLSYPYRCLEQSTSRGIGLLWGATWRSDTGAAIEDAVARVVSLQRWDGSFGLWSSRADAESWLSAYATELLVRAREAGYAVPDVPYDNALVWLANQVAQPGQASYQLSSLAYAHYVLSLAGKADLGRLRHFATTSLEALPAASDAAFIGAALARFGERDLAVQAFTQAVERPPVPTPDDWYGSEIRERAAVVALLAEAGVLDDRLPPLVEELRGLAGPRAWFSTQEAAWLVRAADTLNARNSGEAKVKLGAEAKTFMGSLVERLSEAEAASGVTIVNDGTRALFGAVEVAGVPAQPPAPGAHGIAIERRLLNLDGAELKEAALKQGDLVIVRLFGQVTEEGGHHVLLVDLLPAGLEIENPQLSGADVVKSLPWLNQLSVIEHASARDDRFVAAMRLSSGASFEVAYLARAVTPGDYALPAPYAESMYRADVYGVGATGRLMVTR